MPHPWAKASGGIGGSKTAVAIESNPRSPQSPEARHQAISRTEGTMLALLTETVTEIASMSRKSKWIEADSLDESATTVAQRALEARLTTVYSWLAKAVDDTQTPVESVHQLRVSTRRATAVLQLFEDWLPRKRARWFRKHLKQMRKTAGEARDLDVLAAQLCEYCNANRAAGCPDLQARLAVARQAAQPAISDLHQKMVDRRYRRRLKNLVRKTHWRNEGSDCPTYQEVARTGLRPLAEIFFAASKGDFENILALHEFRIAGKRFRYAMEVFAGAFGPTFRKELYPLVEELQKKLGDINDHATHRDRYLTWHDDTTDESQRQILSTLIAHESSALQTSIREFREWFTTERAADLNARFWQEVGPASEHSDADSNSKQSA
jgi:CHAD domain-containing protein